MALFKSPMRHKRICSKTDAEEASTRFLLKTSTSRYEISLTAPDPVWIFSCRILSQYAQLHAYEPFLWQSVVCFRGNTHYEAGGGDGRLSFLKLSLTFETIPLLISKKKVLAFAVLCARCATNYILLYLCRCLIPLLQRL